MLSVEFFVQKKTKMEWHLKQKTIQNLIITKWTTKRKPNPRKTNIAIKIELQKLGLYHLNLALFLFNFYIKVF